MKNFLVLVAAQQLELSELVLVELNLRVNLRESRPDLKIKLFDRSPRILRDFPERLSNYVKGWFDEHNVDVVANSNITKVEPNTLV